MPKFRSLVVLALAASSIASIACTAPVEPAGQGGQDLTLTYTPPTMDLLPPGCSTWQSDAHQGGVVAKLSVASTTCPTVYVGRTVFQGELVSSAIAEYRARRIVYTCPNITDDQIFAVEYPGIFPACASTSVSYCGYAIAPTNTTTSIAALTTAVSSTRGVASVTPEMDVTVSVDISNGSGCSSNCGSKPAPTGHGT